MKNQPIFDYQSEMDKLRAGFNSISCPWRWCKTDLF